MRRRQVVYFWDVEAIDWDRPVLVCVISSAGDEWSFFGPDCMERFAAFIDEHPGVYLAHYGGGYDVPLLMNVRGFPEIVLTGTNILCARDGALAMRDTYPAWLASLAKVGEAVGLSKMQVDRGDIGGMSEADMIAYCMRDVHVLRRGYEEHRGFLEDRGAPMAWTAGSAARELNKALDPGGWAALEANKCSCEDVCAFLDEGGGRGGRTECWGRGVVEGITSLDFKSSYPARYAFDEVPIGLQEWRNGMSTKDGVFLCDWVWPWRDRIPPAVDFATACGSGPCRSWLCGAELELFEREGVKVQISKGWTGSARAAIGQTFAEVMFQAKEGNGAAKFFAKVFLNSWHGKAMEHPLKEHFTRWRPPEASVHQAFGIDVVGDADGRPDASWFRYFTIEMGIDGMCAPYQQPLMGETILGRARVALWKDAFRELEKAGVPVMYCDTDSCHAKASETEVRQILGDRIGTGIGKLAIEATGCTGYYLGPKAYLLVDSGCKVVKQALKGIPLRSYAKGTIEADGVFREARKGETSRDVRVEVFEKALGGKAVECLKDGVSTFLRGAHGYTDAAGTKTLSRWGRNPQIREVRCSGRGKSFDVASGDPARAWSYVSIEETLRHALLLSCSEGKMSGARWEEAPEDTRADLLDDGLVAFVDKNGRLLAADFEDESYRVTITDLGRIALRHMGEIGPRKKAQE